MSDQDIYRRKAEAKLEEKRAEIDKVKAQLKGASADAEQEGRKALSELEAKFEAAKKRLQRLADAGEDAWEDLAKGFEDAWDDVAGAAKKILARFR